MNKKISKILAVLCTSAVIFAGCGSDSSSQGTSSGSAVSEDHVFQVVLNAAPSGFSPLKTNDSASSDINGQIYETLYKRSYDGSTIEPLLADSLPSYSEDGLTATIKLKSGIKFQDGTDFNSEAVKYVLEKVKDPNSGSLRPSIAESINSIDCPDDTTVVLHLSYPDGVLNAKLAHTNAAMFSPTADQKQDLMTEPVGTGAYKLTNYVSGSEVDLTRNDDYWGDKPQIKDVKFTVVAETSTALSRLETGEADFLPTVPLTQISRAKQINGVTFKSEESPRTVFLSFRTDTAEHPDVMTDLDSRKAMVMSIDIDGYLKTIDGNGTHSNSLVGPKLIGYDASGENDGIKFDLDGAKKIVEEKGLGDKEITILCPNTADYQTLGEYLQANLKDAGFNNVKLNSMDYTSYLTESKGKGKYDICVFGWANVTGDGSEFLEPNFGKSSRAQWNSQELFDLIDASKKTVDMNERTKNIMAANKLLVDNAIGLPVYNSNMNYAFSSNYDIQEDMSQLFYIQDIKIK